MAKTKRKNQKGKKRVFNKKIALGTEFDYRAFIDGMPEEIQGSLEQTVTMLLRYIHQPNISDEIIAAVASQKNVGTAIAQITLQAMDAIDPEHQIDDATKSIAGYFMVKEIVGILHAADVARLNDEDTERIYKNAVQNYIYQTVASQPDQESKDREALRIQQEIEPLVNAMQGGNPQPQGGLSQ